MTQKNNIDFLIINYSDSGGSGHHAQLFTEKLIRNGFSAELLVVIKKSTKDYVKRYPVKEKNNYKVKRKFEDKLNFYKKKYCFYDRGRYIIDSVSSFKKNYFKKPKAIVLMWTSLFISNLIAYKFSKLYNSKLFIHPLDKAHFFGGCHYNSGCFNYLNNCKNCPAVPSYNKNLPFKKFAKQSLLSTHFNLIYHIPWMKNYINSLNHLNFKNTYFVSAEQPKDLSSNNRDFLKKKFGFSDYITVLFGTTNIQDYHKGYHLAEKVILELDKSLVDKKIMIITVGHNPCKIPIKNLNHKHFDYIDNRSEFIEIYKISDIILSTVIDDIGPGILLEAIMCGCVPVSFNVGMAKDLITNNFNGIIIDNFDVSLMVNHLKKMIIESKWSELKYNNDIMIKKYNNKIQNSDQLSSLIQSS